MDVTDSARCLVTIGEIRSVWLLIVFLTGCKEGVMPWKLLTDAAASLVTAEITLGEEITESYTHLISKRTLKLILFHQYNPSDINVILNLQSKES